MLSHYRNSNYMLSTSVVQAPKSKVLEMVGTIFFRLVVQGFWNWVSLYKPTTTLQPKVLGFVWCTLGYCLLCFAGWLGRY